MTPTTDPDAPPKGPASPLPNASPRATAPAIPADAVARILRIVDVVLASPEPIEIEFYSSPRGHVGNRTRGSVEIWTNRDVPELAAVAGIHPLYPGGSAEDRWFRVDRSAYRCSLPVLERTADGTLVIAAPYGGWPAGTPVQLVVIDPEPFPETK